MKTSRNIGHVSVIAIVTDSFSLTGVLSPLDKPRSGGAPWFMRAVHQRRFWDTESRGTVNSVAGGNPGQPLTWGETKMTQEGVMELQSPTHEMR